MGTGGSPAARASEVDIAVRTVADSSLPRRDESLDGRMANKSLFEISRRAQAVDRLARRIPELVVSLGGQVQQARRLAAEPRALILAQSCYSGFLSATSESAPSEKAKNAIGPARLQGDPFEGLYVLPAADQCARKPKTVIGGRPRRLRFPFGK